MKTPFRRFSGRIQTFQESFGTFFHISTRNFIFSPEGFLVKLIKPIKPSGRFRSVYKILYIPVLLLAACAPAPTPYAPPTPIVSHPAKVFDIDISAPASAERFNDPRPNLIFIFTDDQPYHTVDYMPTVKNELMANGVVFDNAFATTPLCCPSRASILSGQYVHNHEVYTNTLPLGGATRFDDTEALSPWIQKAGYRTGYFGKYLNAYEDLQPYGYVPPGWDMWKSFLSKNLTTVEDKGNMQYYFDFSMSENGTAVVYEKSKDNFSADVVTRNALEFIRDSRDEPFMMMVSYYNPHSPYISAPRHKDSFRAGEDYWDWVQYRPPSFNEENIRDKPDYIAELSPLSPTEIDTAHKQILRSLLSVDDGVASVLSALDKAGIKDNTIIIFSTDNGLTLGDHRFGVTKNCPYEACLKVPFVVYAPKYYPHRVETKFAANIDIAPTFAELAGADIPNTVDGLSLVPLLNDSAAKWREDILLEHWRTNEGVGGIIPQYYAVRNAEWKYVEYETGETELYDLVNDPYELQNISGKSKYKEVQNALAERLQELKKE
jgi:arylsulfatase A-like enzyme